VTYSLALLRTTFATVCGYQRFPPWAVGTAGSLTRSSTIPRRGSRVRDGEGCESRSSRPAGWT